MHLYIIRHAQSANNDLYHRTGATVGRQSDPPLTQTGHNQAHFLARFLAGRETGTLGYNAHYHNRDGFDLTHLYTSLMIRSIDTASYISREIGMPIYGWPEIHERGGLYYTDEDGQHVGIQGPNRRYLSANYPYLVLPDSVNERGWWDERPRETNEQATVRARLVWEQLLARHGDSNDQVAFVSHGGFFQSLMSVILSTGDFVESIGVGGIWYTINNASISRIDVTREGVFIRYLNRVDYLPGELITG